MFLYLFRKTLQQYNKRTTSGSIVVNNKKNTTKKGGMSLLLVLLTGWASPAGNKVIKLTHSKLKKKKQNLFWIENIKITKMYIISRGCGKIYDL